MNKTGIIFSTRLSLKGGGGGGTSLQEANGDVPLAGVTFLRLEWLEWGRTFSDFGVSIGIQNGKILG